MAGKRVLQFVLAIVLFVAIVGVAIGLASLPGCMAEQEAQRQIVQLQQDHAQQAQQAQAVTLQQGSVITFTITEETLLDIMAEGHRHEEETLRIATGAVVDTAQSGDTAQAVAATATAGAFSLEAAFGIGLLLVIAGGFIALVVLQKSPKKK